MGGESELYFFGGGAAPQAGLTAKSSARLGSKSASSSSGKRRLGQSSSQFAKRNRASHKVEGNSVVEETEEEHRLRHPKLPRWLFPLRFPEAL